jgi:hypothetical protein
MKVGEYARVLIAEAKENHNIDSRFVEKRLVGIGYKYTFGMWTDEDGANRKYVSFVITDESLAMAKDGAIEAAIKGKFDELIGEFL